MNASNRRQLYSTTLSHSRRSLHSESESDVGSLLSGLSQARKIPDRRKLPTKENGRGALRSKPKSSTANGVANTNNNTTSRQRPPRDGTRQLKQKNEAYKKELPKIIKLQAFARGYIVRFAYQSRLTMEKTKRRFFAIQIQAFVRGFLQRQKYRKITGKKQVKRKIPQSHNNNNTAARTGLGSPQQHRRTRSRDLRRTAPRPNVVNKLPMESDSERSEISIRMERLIANPPIGRRSSIRTADKLGDESEVGSVMSNLSRLSTARKIPDRRRKREAKEAKVVKIQALARGYIQRLLYRSMVAMENTKKKYAAIAIQAYIRGYLQRKNGPQVSRVHVAPKREPLPATKRQPKKPTSTANNDKRRKARYTKRNSQSHGRSSNKNRKIHDPHTPNKTMRKPVRHDSDGGDNMLPRQLTIRKPKRQTSENSEEESHDVPVKHLTIRKPRRQQSQSDGSDDEALPRRVTVSGMNAARHKGRNHNHNNNHVEFSPPRKVMLRVKKGKPHPPHIDLDKSEESLEPDRALMGRSERAANNASERLGESQSESDVGSLMSGLSQARKVPDRRLKRQMPGRSNPKRDDKVNGEKEILKAKNATKIQAIGRGYIARFAYQSKLILEQTKKKFFAIQIQALARGYIVRSKRSK